jgi:hypothetical protein
LLSYYINIMANNGYCYQSIDVGSGYNITNTNYTTPILASGSGTVSNFTGFPNVTYLTSSSSSVDCVSQQGGALGYQINGVDIANTCTAYSQTFNYKSSATEVAVPTWATKIAFLLCGGGGGGGGGCSCGSYDANGSGGCGGGGGGIVIGYVNNLSSTSLSFFNIVVGYGGNGGLGGIPGAVGNGGGNTYIYFYTSNRSSLGSVIAGGGGGGGGGVYSVHTASIQSASTGGGGGAVSNVNIFTTAPTLVSGSTSAGSGGRSGGYTPGSDGATSQLPYVNSVKVGSQNFPTYSSGGGSAADTTGSSVVAGKGSGYGAGGGGGCGVYDSRNVDNTGSAGGFGTDGFAQVWFYI